MALGVSSLPSLKPPPEKAGPLLELAPDSDGSTSSAPASLNALKKSPTFVTFFFLGPRIYGEKKSVPWQRLCLCQLELTIFPELVLPPA